MYQCEGILKGESLRSARYRPPLEGCRDYVAFWFSHAASLRHAESQKYQQTLFPAIWNCHEVFRSNEVPDLMYMVLWYRRLQQVNKQEEEDNTSIYCCLAGPTACQLVRVTFYYMWICMCVCVHAFVYLCMHIHAHTATISSISSSLSFPSYFSSTSSQNTSFTVAPQTRVLAV